MLGFNAFSEQAISDISLPVITGILYATDNNDTANLQGEVLVEGVISTTDGNDFALLSGENRVDGVLDTTDSPDTDQFTGAVAVNGVLSATDGTDTASLLGEIAVDGVILTTDGNDVALLLGELGPTPEPTGIDTHDGFTPEEIRRARNLDRKIREKQLALYKAQQEAKKRRKQQLRDLIDPPKIVAKQKQNKLQSIQEVKADIPSVDTTELEQSIAYLENQRSKLARAVELRKQQAYIQAQLAILEAQRAAEDDDEESILMLL
jgi:hypothetical protein